jgi:hypothetical protein
LALKGKNGNNLRTELDQSHLDAIAGSGSGLRKLRRETRAGQFRI